MRTWGEGPRTKRQRTVRRATSILLLFILAGVVLLAAGCVEITDLTYDNDTEAGPDYTIVLDVKPLLDVDNGRGTVAFRHPAAWIVKSVTYAGTHSGTVTYSPVIRDWYDTTWEAVPDDAGHNGAKGGYVWWAGYGSSSYDLKTTDSYAVTIVVDTRGMAGNLTFDLVAGLAIGSNPEDAAANTVNVPGDLWGLGSIVDNATGAMLDVAVHLDSMTIPTVTAIYPADGASGVSPDVSAKITFSEPMWVSSINADNVFITWVGSPALNVPAVVTYNPATREATINPISPLTVDGRVYMVVANVDVMDVVGNHTSGAEAFFTVAAPVAPTVTAVSPADDATGVAVGTNVTATFDIPMDQATINTTTFTLIRQLVMVPTPLAATVTYNPATKTATLNPAAELEPGVLYQARLSTGAESAEGVALGSSYHWSFTTAEEEPPPVAPVVTAVSPGDGVTGVAVGTNVTATFDIPMDQVTINTTTYALKRQGTATPLTAAVSYNPATKTATLNPAADLLPGVMYQAALGTGVESAEGAGLASSYTWSFTTAVEEPPGEAFTDVVSGSQYYEAIQGMADAGIINGYLNDDGLTYRFLPNNAVWRWQFAKMIVGALDIPCTESMTSPFTDLDPDDPTKLDMTEFVAAAYNNQITQGVAGTNFEPYTEISRAQVVTMVMRALQRLHPEILATPPSGYANAWGVAFSPTHGQNARIAEYNGLLEGLPLAGAASNPWGSMTRGEVAQVLWNVIEKI